MSVSLSACLYQHGSHWTDFREIWYWGLLKKICRETPNIVTTGQKHRVLYMKTSVHLHCWQQYETFVSQQKCKANSWLHSMAKMNTYIIDSYMQVNNNTNGRYCWVPMGPVFTRTRHNVTLLSTFYENKLLHEIRGSNGGIKVKAFCKVKPKSSTKNQH